MVVSFYTCGETSIQLLFIYTKERGGGGGDYTMTRCYWFCFVQERVLLRVEYYPFWVGKLLLNRPSRGRAGNEMVALLGEKDRCNYLVEYECVQSGICS
jgi:hypothetical protein